MPEHSHQQDQENSGQKCPHPGEGKQKQGEGLGHLQWAKTSVRLIYWSIGFSLSLSLVFMWLPVFLLQEVKCGCQEMRPRQATQPRASGRGFQCSWPGFAPHMPARTLKCCLPSCFVEASICVTLIIPANIFCLQRLP